MISDLVGTLFLEMLRFDLGGQFMWLIFMAFVAFCLRLLLRGPSDVWVQSAPSTLLSMGVLGTFSGIVVGLSGFKTANIDQQIGEVLAGISTAFFSSLLAMALSLVFKLVQVRSLQQLKDNDDADAADDIAEKLLIETSNSVKQLRQLNTSMREHSEYLIHITNAVADGSDPNGLLGQMSVQRQHTEMATQRLISELELQREQSGDSLEALMLLHQQQQKLSDARQLSERDFKMRLEGLQQVLMTMPNRRDFRALSAVIAANHESAPVSPAQRRGVRPCP